jgi:hypothetical protein
VKALLIGLGRWGAEVVNEFCYIEKLTDWPVRRDGLNFTRWDILRNRVAFSGLTTVPINIVILFLYFTKPFEMRYSVLFSFYLFLFFIGILNILSWLIFISPLGKHLFKMELTETERERMEEVREMLLEHRRPLKILDSWKPTLHKYLSFQNKMLITTPFLSFILSAPFAVYFYNNFSVIAGILHYLERLPLMNLPLFEYLLTSFGIPLVIAFILRRILFVYYLPQIGRYDFGERKSEKIKRGNVEGIGISLFRDIDDLQYVERRFVLSDKPGDTKYKLRDKIIEIFDKQIKKAEVFDVVIFFGTADSEIVKDFCHIAASLKEGITHPIWFYLRVSGNFISKEQVSSLKKMISDIDGVLVEEESGRIFRLSHEQENVIRTRALERLLVIGESGETSSVRAIDFGAIRNFIRKNSLTVLAYGYLEKVPDEPGHSHKVATELFNMTIHERIFCDINPNSAAHALAIVKTTREKEEGPVFYYDAVRDQMWEIFGENIQVFDIQYILHDKDVTPHYKFEFHEITIDHPDKGIFSLPPEANEEFLDHLAYRNLLVEDIKPKEILVAFTGIDPYLILNKYLPEAAYEEDFKKKIERGVVIDPSFINGFSESSLSKIIEDYSLLSTQDVFFSPSLIKSKKPNEAITLLVDENALKNIGKSLRDLIKTDADLFDRISDKSSQETARSQELIERLSKTIADIEGLETASLHCTVAAEELWLSYVLDIPLLSFTFDSEIPPILKLCKKICYKHDVIPVDITSKIENAVLEWNPIKSGLLENVHNLYIIYPKFQYLRTNENGIAMKSLEYAGGIGDKES